MITQQCPILIHYFLKKKIEGIKGDRGDMGEKDCRGTAVRFYCTF